MQPAPLLSVLDGLAAFHSFLQSEFSDENIEFWMSCEDFKKTKNPVKMATKAKKIYEDFIQADGPKEVRDSSLLPVVFPFPQYHACYRNSEFLLQFSTVLTTAVTKQVSLRLCVYLLLLILIMLS